MFSTIIQGYAFACGELRVDRKVSIPRSDSLGVLGTDEAQKLT